MPHISIKAETLFHIFGFPITNSLLLSFVVLFFFSSVGLAYAGNMNRSNKSNLFYLVSYIIKGIHSLFGSVIGSTIQKFFPLLASIFFFILLNNWFGLLPGVGSLLVTVHDHGHEAHVPLFRANTADLNTTLALALLVVILIQYYGVKYLGFKDYITKFINFANPLNFFIGLLEIISELSRIVSFSFRLFGNIFAGEVLIIVITFLIPWFISWLAAFPFLTLEILVGLIQSVVFAMLTAVFINLAITKHH